MRWRGSPSYGEGEGTSRTPSVPAPAPGTVAGRRREPPLDLPPSGLLHGLAHHLLEDRQQRLRRQWPQPLERLAHLRPLLLRPPRLVERLPDVLHEQIDEHAR